MVGKRHQAWRNLMVAAVLMTGSPANANDRGVYAAYCEQVALELYNKFSAIPPSLVPAFDPDLHAAVVKEHNEILAQDWQTCKTFTDAHVGHYDVEKRTYVQDTTPLPPECLRVRRCQGADDLPY